MSTSRRKAKKNFRRPVDAVIIYPEYLSQAEVAEMHHGIRKQTSSTFILMPDTFQCINLRKRNPLNIRKHERN